MHEAQQLSGDVLALPVELRDWMVLEIHRRLIPWGQVNDIVAHLQSLPVIEPAADKDTDKASPKRRKK